MISQNSEANHKGLGDNIGTYLPKKYIRLLPDKVLATCNCGTDCATRCCKCLKAEVNCVWVTLFWGLRGRNFQS